MTIYFDKVLKFYSVHNFDIPVGCTEKEVAELEAKVGISFPIAYREYLILMGMDFQGAMRGTDCFVTHVLDNNAWLPDLFAENNVTFKLPNNYLTFFSHQGYIMSWFELPAESPDPTVYVFAEGQTKEPELNGSFSNFMTQWILENASIQIELRGK